MNLSEKLQNSIHIYVTRFPTYMYTQITKTPVEYYWV